MDHVEAANRFCGFRTLYGGDSRLLTLAQNIVDWWKDYFEDLLSAFGMEHQGGNSSLKEGGPDSLF